VACTPASGWEKGQVENQVGLFRERFFTPRLRFKTYEEMNAWLLDKCIAYAKAHQHPELAGQTIWEVFEAERPKLVPYAGRFDGFHRHRSTSGWTFFVPALEPSRALDVALPLAPIRQGDLCPRGRDWWSIVFGLRRYWRCAMPFKGRARRPRSRTGPPT
jgi:hypothetical protein